MRVIDQDQSGNVDYDEFIALVYADHETLLQVLRNKVLINFGAPPSGGDANAQVGIEALVSPTAAHAVNRRLRQVFDTMDTDLNGELPLHAFGSAMELLDVQLSSTLHEEMLAIFDADKSGTIDFQEFQKAMMAPEMLEIVRAVPPIPAHMGRPQGQVPRLSVLATTPLPPQPQLKVEELTEL
jgi:hypothetical protein